MSPDTMTADAPSAEAQGPGPAPPRLLSPLSTARVTSRRPTLRWILAPETTGAHVEICRERACTTVVSTFDAAGAQGQPEKDLPAGTLFWRARGRRDGATGTMSSRVWQFSVGLGTSAVDTSWGTTFDANGDGLADIAVGAEGVLNSRGRVYVFDGHAGGPERTARTSPMSPEGQSEYFGHAVASAGDVNGDGYADLVVGAYSHGRAYVYLGSQTGLSIEPISLRGPDAPAFSSFGWSVAGAGDVNGDGYADVLIGAKDVDGGAGSAYVYFGKETGLSAAPDLTLKPGRTGPTSAQFGHAVAGAGDVNGDGYPDLLVTAPGLDITSGAYYLYKGRAGGLESPIEVAGPDGQLGSFGDALAGGLDLNGDGYADALVAAVGAGRVRVYLGSPTGLAPAPVAALESPDGTGFGFGSAAANAGDVNGDGYDDAIIGGPLVLNNVGRAYLYFGRAGGLAAMPGTTLKPPADLVGRFGHAVAGVGDVDGDGIADFLVSAPFADEKLGRVFVYQGNRMGPSATAALTLTGDAAEGLFGGGLAWLARPVGRAAAASPRFTALWPLAW
jgi:hypothetical protein